jgi:ubiquinone/menaquinone biosynthesis C-methylase UbiE
VWADLGAGRGAFTLAVRDLAGPGAEIYAIDRDAGALAALRREMDRRFADTTLHLVPGDFTAELRLPPLDGAIAANSLHFVPTRAQAEALKSWRRYIRPQGRLILVEYDADEGNPWVPYPISFQRLAGLAEMAGYTAPVLLADHPSRMMGRIYSAVVVRPAV